MFIDDEGAEAAEAPPPLIDVKRASVAQPAVPLKRVRTAVVEPLTWLEFPAQQGGVSFSRAEGKLAIAGNQLVTVFDIISGGTLLKMPRNGRTPSGRVKR